MFKSVNPLDLYHGGEAPVKVPHVVSPKSVRPLDFGSGFYTTTSRDQARKWIGIRLRQHAYETGCVSHFTTDRDAFGKSGLKVLAFNGPEEAWFDFVMDNRHTVGFSHDYDVVMGPVANDNVYETLTLFEDGIITKAEAIARLKTYKLVDQVLFHTEAALKLLRFVDSEVVA